MRKKKNGFQKLWSKINLILLLGIAPSLLASCDFFRFKRNDAAENKNPIVASASGNQLRADDLSFITKETSSTSDSASLANRYVQSWIKKQLMIKEASKNITIDQAELERKILDYKYALIVYEYEKDHVEKNLNKEVSMDEIKDYYEGHQNNFTLKEIIVRTNFVKMEKSIGQNTQAERLLNNLENDQNKQQLRELALKSATNYFLEDSTWIKLDDIILNTPMAEADNLVQLVQRNRLIKMEDEEYNYYFKILEFRLRDQVPPVDFVRDEITKIIINKRKVALAEALQNEIYNRALENNEFEVYEQP